MNVHTPCGSHLIRQIGLISLILITPATAQELTHATLAPGGGRSTGGTITNDATLGDIGGEAHEQSGTTVRPGFAGQLWDVATLDISPQPATIGAESTLQLTTLLTGDDTTTQPSPADIVWSSDSFSLSVSPTGLLTSGPVPTDQNATITAQSSSLSATAGVLIYDLTPDNFGPFAGDSLDDAWQQFYFGSDPALAAPTLDPDGDGQNNAFEFLVGTGPQDSASWLQTWIVPEPNQPTVYQLFFMPIAPGRSYSWEYSTTLQDPWRPVIGDPPDPLPTGEARATDEIATEPQKFYRLRIE